ncbi:MAG: M20/M25/M40 family metallo-hydrolase [Marinilabiliales bacterium]|nr:MAG: M20/M25/M40 family metallo-hydrolase [Marinilabiliales bacterium]
MHRTILTFLIIFSGFQPVFSQDRIVEAIFSNALNSYVAYENLRVLCETTEGRISGSPAAAAAVEFTRQIMENMDLDSVYLQEMMVPNWRRGEPEFARIISSRYGNTDLNVIALGLSVGTGERGITAGVVELGGIDEIEKAGRENIEGKIVFFNGKVDQSHYNTFEGYSGAVGQRFHGPALAADHGAVAAIVRSVTTADHDYPHTGVTRFREEGGNIPALAVSPVGAGILSDMLKADPDLKLFIRNTSHRLPDVISYNVIGEIRGSTYPGQIITVGGHLDSWDNSPGAHDDGAGCMQSIDVLRIFRELDIRPKRTVRAVMFMDEEISQRGGRKYAAEASRNDEKHYFAIESDRGAFTPRGFSIDGSEEQLAAIQSLKPYFEPYGIHEIFSGGSGVDISFLRNYYDMALAGLVTDSQRYFDLHHAATDTFDQVNRREMQLGTAAMAALIYLLDHFDLLEP